MTETLLCNKTFPLSALFANSEVLYKQTTRI